MGIIQKQGIQNTILTYVGIIIGFVNVLILQPFMLKPEELGLTRILFSASVLIAAIFPFGFNGVTIKYFPKFRDSEKNNNGYLSFLLLVAFISYCICFVVIYLFKDNFIKMYSVKSPLFSEYFSYVLPLTFFIGFSTLFTIYLFSQFKTSFPTFINDVYSRIYVTIIVSVYFLHLINFSWFIRLFALGYVMQMLILLIYSRKFERINFKINIGLLKEIGLMQIFKYAFIMMLATLSSIAIKNIDVLILGVYVPLNEVAIYTIAITIAGIIEAPATALGRIADSKISDSFTKNDMQQVQIIYFKSTRLLTIIGMILFIGIWININSLLQLLPNSYSNGENVVLIVSLSALFNMMTGINSSIIFYSHKYFYGTLLLFGLVAISFVLNIILVPYIGIIGAACATAISFFLFNLIKYIFILKHFKLQPFGNYFFQILIIALVCLLVNYFLPQLQNHIINIIYRSIIIIGIYYFGLNYFNLMPELKEIIDKKFKK